MSGVPILRTQETFSSRANLDQYFHMLVLLLDKGLEAFLFNFVHLDDSRDHRFGLQAPYPGRISTRSNTEGFQKLT